MTIPLDLSHAVAVIEAERPALASLATGAVDASRCFVREYGACLDVAMAIAEHLRPLLPDVVSFSPYDLEAGDDEDAYPPHTVLQCTYLDLEDWTGCWVIYVDVDWSLYETAVWRDGRWRFARARNFTALEAGDVEVRAYGWDGLPGDVQGWILRRRSRGL